MGMCKPHAGPFRCPTGALAHGGNAAGGRTLAHCHSTKPLMEMIPHDLNHLFEQLGLSGHTEDINSFIEAHRLQSDVSILQAWFWEVSQVQFLTKALAEDSDWSNAVDVLAARLTTG